MRAVAMYSYLFLSSPLFFTVTIHAGSTGQRAIHLQTRSVSGQAACYRMQIRPGLPGQRENRGLLAHQRGMQALYEH